jgi:ferrous iron transport protein B
MQKIGLHGKSFLPMVVGFGCSVPGLYATRTLDNHKDRVLTGLLVPFMSCGARLPVYVLFAAIFFPKQAGLVIFGLYLLGILTAIVLGLILRRTLFKTKEDVNDSAFGSISGAVAPVFAPLGFGSWEAAGALMSGFVAKEVVVSTTALVYNVPEGTAPADTSPAGFAADLTTIFGGFFTATVDALKSVPQIIGLNLFPAEDDTPPTDLMQAVQAGFEQTSGGHGALAALAFMVFVLLYTPCMVTVAAMRHELGGRWTLLSVVGQFVIAWVMALVVFQGGLLLL